MLRIIAFLFVTLLLSAASWFSPKENFLEGADKVTFVTSEQCKIEDAQITFSGGQTYVTVAESQTKNVRNQLRKVQGTIYYFNDLSKEKQLFSLLNFKMPEKNIAGSRVVTGYTSSYKDFVLVDNKKVNVQIAVTDSQIIVGFPLILTGF